MRQKCTRSSAGFPLGTVVLRRDGAAGLSRSLDRISITLMIECAAASNFRVLPTSASGPYSEARRENVVRLSPIDQGHQPKRQSQIHSGRARVLEGPTIAPGGSPAIDDPSQPTSSASLRPGRGAAPLPITRARAQTGVRGRGTGWRQMSASPITSLKPLRNSTAKAT